MIPKSTHKERMVQNIAVFDFVLTDEEMNRISELDIGHSEIVNHTDYERRRIWAASFRYYD